MSPYTFLLGLHWSRSCLLKFSLEVWALSIRTAALQSRITRQQKSQLWLRTTWDTNEASVTEREITEKREEKFHSCPLTAEVQLEHSPDYSSLSYGKPPGQETAASPKQFLMVGAREAPPSTPLHTTALSCTQPLFVHSRESWWTLSNDGPKYFCGWSLIPQQFYTSITIHSYGGVPSLHQQVKR